MKVADERLDVGEVIDVEGTQAGLGHAWRHHRDLLWLLEEVELETPKLHAVGLSPTCEDSVVSFVTDNNEGFVESDRRARIADQANAQKCVEKTLA